MTEFTCVQCHTVSTAERICCTSLGEDDPVCADCCEHPYDDTVRGYDEVQAERLRVQLASAGQPTVETKKTIEVLREALSALIDAADARELSDLRQSSLSRAVKVAKRVYDETE